MHPIAITGIALAVLLELTTPAQAEPSAFICPQAIDATTPAKQAEIRKLLPLGDVLDDPERLNASIDGLRRLGLTQTMIINHLIGAYCPTVAQDNSLSVSEKTAKVRRFAGRITTLVPKEEDISEILLSVPLKPSIVDEVNERAKASGLPVEKWLSRTIETAVQTR